MTWQVTSQWDTAKSVMMSHWYHLGMCSDIFGRFWLFLKQRLEYWFFSSNKVVSGAAWWACWKFVQNVQFSRRFQGALMRYSRPIRSQFIAISMSNIQHFFMNLGSVYFASFWRSETTLIHEPTEQGRNFGKISAEVLGSNRGKRVNFVQKWLQPRQKWRFRLFIAEAREAEEALN